MRHITCAGLDVTHQCDLMGLRSLLKEHGGHVASFLHDITHYYCAAYFRLGKFVYYATSHSSPFQLSFSRKSRAHWCTHEHIHQFKTWSKDLNITDVCSGHSSVPVHDPTTIAYMLKPDLFSWRSVHVDVEVDGSLTRCVCMHDLD
jgi:inosine-uridine nucleoside N-ribohydrolase